MKKTEIKEMIDGLVASKKNLLIILKEAKTQKGLSEDKKSECRDLIRECNQKIIDGKNIDRKLMNRVAYAKLSTIEGKDASLEVFSSDDSEAKLTSVVNKLAFNFGKKFVKGFFTSVTRKKNNFYPQEIRINAEVIDNFEGEAIERLANYLVNNYIESRNSSAESKDLISKLKSNSDMQSQKVLIIEYLTDEHPVKTKNDTFFKNSGKNLFKLLMDKIDEIFIDCLKSITEYDTQATMTLAHN